MYLSDLVFPRDEQHLSETSKNGRCYKNEYTTGMEASHDNQRHFH